MSQGIETTNISIANQALVFVRYAHSDLGDAARPSAAQGCR
jgi:hypothetical protein